MSARTAADVQQAWASVRAHRGSLSGTFVVIALAAALLAATGRLLESGLRASGTEGDTGLLAALAGSFAGTALVVVVLVVASTVTLALRQRRQELALLRAVGATRTQVRRAIRTELLLVTVLAAPLGAVPGLLAAGATRPLLRDAGMIGADTALVLDPAAALGAVALLLPVALVAGRLATRETLRQPPTVAVRDSGVEHREIGRVRRALAIVTAALGLLAAGSPLVVPGTAGSASAAMSALLLVAAAALAGPLLVTWLLARTGSLSGRVRRPATRLALANSRGFSRRLATVVVPLAVMVAVGTVQGSVSSAVATAGAEQLRAGLTADLVVTDPDGGPLDAPAVAATTGVQHAYPLAAVTARVRTDDEAVPGLASLSWESVGLRVLPAGGVGTSYDPGVVAGSLRSLDEPGTVAVSTDARFETGKGLGDGVEVRLPGDHTTTLRVVAVYDQGLGFGGYLVGAPTMTAADVPTRVDTVLVETTDPDGVRRELASRGVTATTPAAYADAATTADAGEQRLSLVLLVALLAFVAVAAANALVMATAGRRGELVLLRRTGATRRQLVTMSLVEALVTAGVAWLIGTVALVPAVIGVSAGLLGLAVPVVDLTTYALLSAVVLVVAVGSIVPTVAVRSR
ncbi:FtsX-like permease family protein [Nocardioides sp. URHA0020]|uniref:FtsX-like permease family protein n=1 Tax=Nocardioides sp. URHA0020 TaxID=1380392 RepID=UPI00048F091F|nr:ABC transporter permease [Nocardioides sp. URHA0020]